MNCEKILYTNFVMISKKKLVLNVIDKNPVDVLEEP
jgi:hypothetical protein